MTVTWILAGILFKCKRYGELSNMANRYATSRPVGHSSVVVCCVVSKLFLVYSITREFREGQFAYDNLSHNLPVFLFLSFSSSRSRY